MSAATYIATLLFGALAFAPLGALMAAALAREYLHVVIMMYWVGGFGTVAHALVVFR